MLAQTKRNLFIIPNDSAGKSVLKEPKLYSESRDSSSIIRLLNEFAGKKFDENYNTLGYDSIVWDNSTVKAYISLGDNYTFDLEMNDTLPREFQNLLKGNLYSNSKTLQYNEFLEFREKLVRFYEDNGYPFSSVELSNPMIYGSKIFSKLKVNKNTFVRLDSIVIKGGPKISGKYLIHCLGIKSGQPYNQSQIDQVGKNIEKLNFIRQIRPTEIEFIGNRADLYLYLKNKPANSFSGIIGLVSDSIQGSELKLTGDISLILQNTFKIGDKINFYWNRYNSASQILQLSVHFPYIFLLPIGIDTRISLEKFQVAYLNTGAFFSLTYNFNGNNGIKAYIQRKASFVIDDSLNTGSNIGFSGTTAGLNFFIDNLDNPLNPAGGYFFEAGSGYGNTLNADGKTHSLLEFNFEGAYYLKISQLVVFAFLNKSSGLVGPENFYQNQMYKLGGINSLRGFDDKSIFASAYSIFSFEPRILAGRRSSFFLFTDLAWYESRFPGKYFTNALLGFGTGMNIDTKAGIFKLVYALGKQSGNPIRFSNSKIHFGYSASF